ncbi:MAG: hypothetical protein R3C68_10855 [Myxococcota bacterium]
MFAIRSCAAKKRSGKVLHASPTSNWWVRAGVGLNTIDVDAANACGIFAANCPGKMPSLAETYH